jgi:hypothetical protein
MQAYSRSSTEFPARFRRTATAPLSAGGAAGRCQDVQTGTVKSARSGSPTGPLVAPATGDPGRPAAKPYILAGAGGAVGHWLAALVLWFAAEAKAFQQCRQNAYGLAIEGGGVSTTSAGCVVDIPTRSGHLEALLPTLDSGLAAAAAVVAALGAVWPLILLITYARRRR